MIGGEYGWFPYGKGIVTNQPGMKRLGPLGQGLLYVPFLEMTFSLEAFFKGRIFSLFFFVMFKG